jgi:hypothetical protein
MTRGKMILEIKKYLFKNADLLIGSEGFKNPLSLFVLIKLITLEFT